MQFQLENRKNKWKRKIRIFIIFSFVNWTLYKHKIHFSFFSITLWNVWNVLWRCHHHQQQQQQKNGLQKNEGKCTSRPFLFLWVKATIICRAWTVFFFFITNVMYSLSCSQENTRHRDNCILFVFFAWFSVKSE